jgi:hypothetical protein
MAWLNRSQVERFAFAAAVASWVGFALAAMWEITAPLAAGHAASGAAFTIAGEQMVKWKIFGTVFPYVTGRPEPSQYYTHHPWGTTFVSALIAKLIGHGWVATRLPAVLFSAFSPPLVYRIARVLWGVIPAAVASIAFVFVPMSLSFANFWNLEVPTIFGGLVFTLGTVQFWQTWRARHLWVASLGALVAAQMDWMGAVLVAAFVLFAFVRAYVLPRRRRALRKRIDERGHARWFAFTTAAAVMTVLFYVALAARYGRMEDFVHSYTSRVEGSEVPFAQQFTGGRQLWLMWMFTPVGLWAAGLGLVVAAVRLVFRRDVFAFVLLAWAAMNGFEYFVFKQAADTHVFWPHPFNVNVALGCGILAHWLLGVRDWIVFKRPKELVRRVSAIAAGVLLVLPLLLLARAALPLFWQARLTAGRFDERGRSTDSERDRAIFAEWAARGLPENAVVLTHRPFGSMLNVNYAAQRQCIDVERPFDGAPKDTVEGALLLDARKVSWNELRTVARMNGVTAAGPFWRVDRSPGAAAAHPFVAMTVEEHVPRGFERLGLGTDLVRAIKDDMDPWATWDWRVHLGVPATPPAGQPTTFAQIRVAHNAAILANDLGRASELRAHLEALLTNKNRFDYTNDVHLLGYRFEDGPPYVMTLLFEAGPAFAPTDSAFMVKSNVIARPPLWPAPIDGYEKEVSTRPFIGLMAYKPRFLYEQRFVVHKRIGRERYFGFFAPLADNVTPPRLEGGAPRATLLTLD